MKKKLIPNYPNYAVTRDGRVWSKPKAGGGHHNGKWLKPIKDRDGYLLVGLYKNGKEFGHRVHRLVLETYVGPCPEGMECRHLDGNSSNNSLPNLCWGTHQENEQDRLRHGTDNRGEKHGQAKLTESDVREIRDLCNYLTQREIGKRYSISQQQVSYIIHRKKWKHI